MNQNAIDRRAVFERIRSKYLNAGFSFENDPIFLEWVEKWIEGDMTSAELRSRYLRLIQQKERERQRLREIEE